MTLDEYIVARFGPVLSELSDMGYPTEGLEAVLKRGVVWSLMDRLSTVPMGSKAYAGELRFGLFTSSNLGKDGRVTEATIQNRQMFDVGPRPTIANFTPDDIFPHLTHLIEQEALP
jgi:hypothetical protein